MSKQIGARVSNRTAARIAHLANLHGSSQGAVIETALDLYHAMSSELARGALNESEQLAALEVLQSYQIEPAPSRALKFVQRYGARLLDTLWLATRQLDDAGIRQPARGARADLGIQGG